MDLTRFLVEVSLDWRHTTQFSEYYKVEVDQIPYHHDHCRFFMKVPFIETKHGKNVETKSYWV